MSPTNDQLQQAARAAAEQHSPDHVRETIGQYVPAGVKPIITNVAPEKLQALFFELDMLANPGEVYVPPGAAPKPEPEEWMLVPPVASAPSPAPETPVSALPERLAPDLSEAKRKQQPPLGNELDTGTEVQIAMAKTFKATSTNHKLTLKLLASKIAALPAIADKKDGYIIHAGVFPEGASTRGLDNIEWVTMLMHDYDGRNGDTIKREDLKAKCASAGVEVIFWDTHTPDDNGTTFRAGFPLKAVLAIDLHGPAQAALDTFLGGGPLKPLPASQGFFCQPRPGRSANVEVIHGKPIDTLLDFSKLEPEPVLRRGEGEHGAAIGSTLTNEQVTDARIVIAALRTKGAHLSDGKGRWHRVIGALAPYQQGYELACEFSEGDPEFSHRAVSTKIKQKLRKGATGIGNLFAIAAAEGIANPGAGVRQSAAEAFGSSEVPDEVGAVSLDIPFDVDWPPGLVGEIARYVHQTCLVPVKSFSIATALFALSLLSANKFYVRRTDTGLNLYQVLSGPTGSGKEGPRKSLDKLFEGTVFANHIWETAASATGLLRAMSGDNEPVFAAVPDEFGLMMQSYAGKRANPNHVMLVKCWLQLFGCPRGTFKPTAYANDRDNIPPIYKPYFLLLGMTTPETLYPAFTKDMVDAGTVNRIIVVSLAGVEAENTDLDFTVPKALADSILAFDAAFSFAEEVPLEFEDGAFELLEQLAKNPDTEDTPAALWGRYREQVIRVAGVLAVGDGRLITKAHVIWAHRYVDWCVRGFVRKLVPRLAEGNFAELANKALEVIRNPKNYAGDKQFAKLCRKGLMPTGKLSKLLHIPSKEKATVVEYLLETQQIKCGNVDGQEVFWVPK